MIGTSLIPEASGARPQVSGETAPEDILRLSEVHNAIDVIGEVFVRYYTLFEAAEMLP